MFGFIGPISLADPLPTDTATNLDYLGGLPEETDEPSC